MRVSTLLDDMLCSAVIQLKILDVSMASRRGSAQLSGRSIDTVAFERRASKLLIRNKDRFRDFSPAVTSRPSKMSPGLNTPKGEDWPTMTPIKSGALSERDERVVEIFKDDYEIFNKDSDSSPLLHSLIEFSTCS